MTFTNILNGSPLDPDFVMSNFKHVNYGSPLLPVNTSGTAVDNTVALGGSASRFAGTYTNGIASGAVGAPLWKWGRVSLGPKNIVGGLSPGSTLLFTVDLSSISTSYAAIMWSLTLIGDNGLIVGSAEKIIHYSSRSGYVDTAYPAFHIIPVTQTTVNVYENLWFSGVYTSYSSYFQTNSANWDDATANRGYLEVFYVTP